MPSRGVSGDLAAVILVGGRSQRMGRPKATLPLGGRSLLAHVLVVVAPLVREVVLVAAADQAIPAELLRSGAADGPAVRIVHDRVFGAGPLSALALGLGAVTAEVAIALPCDAPFVRPALVAELARRLTDAATLQALIPEWDGHVQPLVAVYRPRIATALDALVARGETRLRAVAQIPDVAVVGEDEVRAFDPTGESFRVLNTPADLAAAESLLAARGGGRSES